MVLAAIAGYLLGSIPTAVLVGRFFRVDPRVQGDGNPGWWNMRALVGERAAAVVLAGDVLKGVLAAVVGILLWGPWWVAYVGVFFAMVGHAVPLFARFFGGRAVLTFLGGMTVLAPLAVAVAVGIGGVIALATRHLVYGARAAVFLVPVLQAPMAPASRVGATLVLLAFIGLRFLSAPVPVRPPKAPDADRVLAG